MNPEKMKSILSRLETRMSPPIKESPKPNPFSDLELRCLEKRRTTKSPGPMELVTDLLLRDRDQTGKPNVTINNQGHITVNEGQISYLIDHLIKKDKPDVKTAASNLVSIFGKGNCKDMAAASLISYLSPDDEIASVGWLNVHKGKDYYRDIKRVISAFKKALVEVSAGKTNQELKTDLNKLYKSGRFDFSEINRHLGKILYSQFYPDKSIPSANKLEEFLLEPGVIPVLFALRKTYFIHELNHQVKTVGFDKQRYPILSPNSDINNKMQFKIDGYKNSVRDSAFDPVDFYDLSTRDILNHLAYFVIEGRVKAERKDFAKRRITPSIDKDGETHHKLTILDFLFPDQDHEVKNDGIVVPITSRLTIMYPNTAYIDIESNDVGISNIFVPIDNKS